MGRAPIKLLPDREELQRLFAYDPERGGLTWRVQLPKAYRARPGTLAGTLNSRGYLHVGIAGTYYYAHRIIWKMMTGEEPTFQIDHIDGYRTHNKWANLRPATNAQNRWNSKLPKNNTSGVKGVCWDSGHRAWAAVINKQRIGRFKSFEDACTARTAAAERLHSEFLRIS